MQAVDHSAGRLMRDIRAVEWLPLSAAIDRLSLPHEQSFLREVGPYALRKAMEKAPVSEPTPAIVEPPMDKEPAVVVPDAAAASRADSPSRWNVLARLIQRLLGQQSSAA
jgi:8-oxo-dGTP diphosphatase